MGIRELSGLSNKELLDLALNDVSASPLAVELAVRLIQKQEEYQALFELAEQVNKAYKKNAKQGELAV